MTKRTKAKPKTEPKPAQQGIPLPARNEPSPIPLTKEQALMEFFQAAWEKWQEKERDVCITNTAMVRALRQPWYDYLEAQGYSRNTASVVAGKWYAQARRDPKLQRPRRP